MRRILALIFALHAAVAAAQVAPAVPRPAQFRFGIRVVPGVRPSDPEEGHVYQDSTTHIFYIYNGSEWTAVGSVVDTGTAGQVLTSQGTGTPVWADVSGDGVPGGGAGAVQYKNGGSFGGTNLTYSGGVFTSAFNSTATGAWIKNTGQATAESTEHFEIVIGSATNDVPPGDTRPDFVAAIGWNASGAATGTLPNGTGVGSSQLSFETYCSYGTGCLGGGGGQSETYFSMSDGAGHSVRPLGFFQGKFMDPEHAGEMSVIARANTWSFFDAGQTYPIFNIYDNDGSGIVNFYDSRLNSDRDVDTTAFTINGNNAVGIGPAGSIDIGRAANVRLAPSGSGTYVEVETNELRMVSNCFYDTSSAHRGCWGAGSETNYPSLAASGTTEIMMKPLGSSSDIQLTLQSQGNGIVRMNPQGTGVSQLGKHVRTSDSVPTVAGTTSNACGTTTPTIAGTDTAGRVTVGATSGTSCTVTFNHQYLSSIPACVANNETTAGVVKATASSTTLILAGTFTAGDKLTYICIEY